MRYFIILLLAFVNPNTWGSDYDSDSSNSSDGQPITLPDTFGMTPAECRRLLDEQIALSINQFDDRLPLELKRNLPKIDPYDSDDFSEAITPEGYQKFTEASRGFRKNGSEDEKYAPLMEEMDARRRQRQQSNGHHDEHEEEIAEDPASAPSSDEDETSSVIDWDIADKITEEAKQKPDPMDWLLKIDWASLETLPAVSPSKRSSIKPTIELLRKANWRTLSSFPHDGWTFERKEDLGALTGKCDLCNHKLRYRHILSHPEVEGVICAGGTCASHLLKDRATIEHERQARLSSDPSLNALIAAIQSLSVE